ncbi:hypothetical protein GCM10023116_38120 [Kistimonas scapharcae]|uniref:Methyltransferase small domain-containing protein n=1 Tax=Kistimonas scapharcae TaxID=1036133 RepID=A0ABP8V5J1_9GAMM
MAALEITVLVCLFLVVVLIAGFTLKNGIGPTPSCRRTTDTLDNRLPETIDGVILELGCGWGGIALYLARKYPENAVVAWENSPVPWLVAYLRKVLSGQDNLSVRYGDFRRASLDHCGLIYCYLCTGQMLRLRELLLPASVNQSCQLVSSTFSVPGWTPASEYPLGDWYGSRLWVYMLSHQPSSLNALSRFSSK